MNKSDTLELLCTTLTTALNDIAGGIIPVLPSTDNMNKFGDEMWQWSQKRARRALEEAKGFHKILEEEEHEEELNNGQFGVGA